jgi:drug/metabolite transporter (DMT)-like permease
MKQHWIGPLALIGAAVIWGFVPVASRYAVQTLTPGQMILCRFAFGGSVVLLLVLLLRPPMPNRRRLPLAVFFGLLSTLGFNVPLSYGIQHVQAGPAALLAGLSPVFIVVLAAPLLGEHIRPGMIVGLTLALAGTVIVASSSGGEFNFSREHTFGSALIVLSSVLWAIYSVAAKPRLGPIPPTSIPILGTLAGIPVGITLGASGFASSLGELDGAGWAAVMLFSIGASVFAPMLYAIGLSRGEASRAGIYSYLAPLFGLIASATLLDEPITVQTVTGGALILAGVLLATLLPGRAPIPSPAEAASD